MRNKRIFQAGCIVLFCLGSQPLFSAPYTAWQEDYTGQEPHTIALWKFNASTGDNKNSYDGTANPNAYPPVGLHAGTAQTKVEGKFESGLLIVDQADKDNDSRAFSVSDPGQLFHGSALSVDVWYKTPNDVPSDGYLFDKMYISKSGIRLYFREGKLLLDVGNGKEIATLNITAPVLEPNTWYHFAATYENSGGYGILKIFLNGELLGDSKIPGFGDLDAGDRPWTIGNRSGSTYSPWLGTYDNFRISDMAYEFSKP